MGTKDFEWHECRKKDLPDWLQSNLGELDRGIVKIANIEYRRTRENGIFERRRLHAVPGAGTAPAGTTDGGEAAAQEQPRKRPEVNMSSALDGIKESSGQKLDVNFGDITATDSFIMDKRQQFMHVDQHFHGAALEQRYEKYRDLRSGLLEAFVATDKTGTYVVCKVLPSGFAAAAELDDYLKAQGLCKQMFGISSYIGVLSISGQTCVVRKYCRGEPLSTQLDGKKVLEDTKVWKLLGGICHIMRNTRGRSHGSLHPDNIILDSRGEVQLTDFAIDRVKGMIAANDRSFSQHHNQSLYFHQ